MNISIGSTGKEVAVACKALHGKTAVIQAAELKDMLQVAEIGIEPGSISKNIEGTKSDTARQQLCANKLFMKDLGLETLKEEIIYSNDQIQQIINAKLEPKEMRKQLKEIGYCINIRCQLHCVQVNIKTNYY